MLEPVCVIFILVHM